MGGGLVLSHPTAPVNTQCKYHTAVIGVIGLRGNHIVDARARNFAPISESQILFGCQGG